MTNTDPKRLILNAFGIDPFKTINGVSILGVGGDIDTGSSSGLIHPDSPGASLPTTSSFIGELFVKTSSVEGVYSSLDLVGNWSGPLT